jgi:hypothetical protein
MILLISAFQLVKIIGMGHKHQARKINFRKEKK